MAINIPNRLIAILTSRNLMVTCMPCKLLPKRCQASHLHMPVHPQIPNLGRLNKIVTKSLFLLKVVGRSNALASHPYDLYARGYSSLVAHVDFSRYSAQNGARWFQNCSSLRRFTCT